MQKKKTMFLNKLLFLALLLPSLAYAQSDTTFTPNKKGLRTAAIVTGGAYAIGMAGLNHLWYKDSDRQSFQFFNDNREWKQIDKIGHFYSAFHLSSGASKGLQHFNIKPSRADLVGAIAGFAVLLPIEIFDGYSDAYGASFGDIVADAAGSLFYLGQRSLWSEIRLHPKFSYHHTSYAALRPELLGSGAERIIKDYNGQTYWLSVDVDKFVTFPKWLNIAFGYGANGMIYARDWQHRENNLPLPQREFYISIDPDLTAIKSNSSFIRTLLFFANMIKIPSPTLRFRGSGASFHPLYF